MIQRIVAIPALTVPDTAKVVALLRQPLDPLVSRLNIPPQPRNAATGPIEAGVINRTAFIDHYLKKALKEGAKQVVILGSGYDLRPIRLDELSNTPVFEVNLDEKAPNTKRDFPEYQSRQEKSQWVTGDYTQEETWSSLTQKGLNTKEDTVFILEGNIMYLTTEQVDYLAKKIATFSKATLLYNSMEESVRDTEMGDTQIVKLWHLGNRIKSFEAAGLTTVVSVNGETAHQQLKEIDPRIADFPFSGPYSGDAYQLHVLKKD